jgi:hypothetical protein
MSLIKGKQLSNPFQYSGSFNVTGSVSASEFTGPISASYIVGLNLDNSRIASGSITASVSPLGFTILNGGNQLLFVSSSGRLNIGQIASSLDAITITGSQGITWNSTVSPFNTPVRVYSNADNLRFSVGTTSGKAYIFEGAGVSFEDSGSGFANFVNRVLIAPPGGTGTALSVIGTGVSSTSALLVRNSNNQIILAGKDNQYVGINTDSPQAVLHVSSSQTQPVISGSFTYNTLIQPSFINTAADQTQVAFRVNPTFTGSFSGSQASNIIADFGSSNVGTQLLINDEVSGSIYVVNDISGLPLLEGTSDWVINMYEYPYIIFQKTGSILNLGISRVTDTGSIVNIKSNISLNNGFGFSKVETQRSSSTAGAVTSSVYTLDLNSNQTAYVSAIVTGYDTTTRNVVAGEIKKTFKRAGGDALLVSTGSKYVDYDSATNPANFDFIVGSTSGSLVVYGSGSGLYNWYATITTQII